MVSEYQTPNGSKVREIGPILYGYSMTFGPDGKPKVRVFGNVQSAGRSNSGIGLTAASDAAATAGIETNPQQTTAEREPLVDVNVTDKKVRVVLEILGVKKEDIKIYAYDKAVEVTANNPQRKYHKTIELPKDADIETAKSTYRNGILEITFSKKENSKPNGKEKKKNNMFQKLDNSVFSSLKRIFRM